jgi:hypothetical protein
VGTTTWHERFDVCSTPQTEEPEQPERQLETWERLWPDYPPLPEFLIISAEDRRRSWQGVSLVPTLQEQQADDWRLRNAAIVEQQKQKKLESLQRLKDKHPGQHYDRKLRKWVPDAHT